MNINRQISNGESNLLQYVFRIMFCFIRSPCHIFYCFLSSRVRFGRPNICNLKLGIKYVLVQKGKLLVHNRDNK